MKSIREGLSLAWIGILILGMALTGCSPVSSGEIIYYEETKIITEEETENIIEVTENRTRILFGETTAFVAGIEPGDILMSEDPVPGAEYGFLERVTGVSDEGKVVEIEPATMEDAIEEGVILVTENIPLEDLMNDALWAMGVHVLQVPGGYQFSYNPAEGVTIEGYLLFTADAEVHIEASFLRGLEEFEFVFSPGLEMEATLRVEQGIEWDEKYTIATIPGPPIPIWGPVTITPEIELVVGTTGMVDASLEATVTYDRVYDVGLRYDGSWTPISDMRGGGATLEEPSFSGQCEALVFGGVVLSGTAGVSYVAEASLEAELLGNIRASGEIENSPWRWQYDLELSLSAQVFADLNLLRIAHVSWESDPWEYPDPPYNLAYGASGRVTTEGGEGLDGVQISFSDGHSSVTSDIDGYWCKHLLRGEVVATPGKTGYTFDPPSMTITGSASDLNFQAFGEEPAQYELTITSTAGGTVTTPGEGISTHDAGTVVDLVATPDTGYRFVNWIGDVSTIANVNAETTTIIMNGDYEIAANFAGMYNVQTIYTTFEGMFQIHSGDIDGDGFPEASILLNADGSLFVDYQDEDYAVSYVSHNSGSAAVYGDVADTDGDGYAEIIAGTMSSVQVISYSAPNVFQIDASISIDGGVRGVIAGDIRNDGSMRIIAGSAHSGYVHVFKYDQGNYVEEWSEVVFPGGEITPTAVGDVDNDGKNEFLVYVMETPGYCPTNGNIYMYEWTGATYELVLVQHLGSPSCYMPAAITDLDRDGNNELIIDTGKLSVYRYLLQDNEFEHVWSALDGDVNQVAIGDADGDGQDEVVCCFPWTTPGKIVIIGYDGTEYNVEARITDFPDGLGGGTVADFDDDGQNEIITSLFNVVATEHPVFLVEYAPPTP